MKDIILSQCPANNNRFNTLITGLLLIVAATHISTVTKAQEQPKAATSYTEAVNKEVLKRYIPKYKAFCAAEDATHTMHNLLPIRGSKVRAASDWAGYLDQSIDMFGNDMDVVFSCRTWPTFGHERCIAYLEKQRDMYKYINDQTIHLANEGLNPDEIAERISLPAELKNEWYNGEYYGTLKQNAKATYQYYLGSFDGNPAGYDPLPQTEAAIKYVEYMGGEASILEKAKQNFIHGEYRWVAEVLKQVVFANPDNQAARNLQADAMEQLGYQNQSASARNMYLTGAMELRRKSHGYPVNPAARLAFFKNLTPEALIEFLAVSIDGQRAAGKVLSIRLMIPEQNKNIFIDLKNGVLHQKNNIPMEKADFTLSISKDKFDQLLASGSAEDSGKIMHSRDVKMAGDPSRFRELTGLFEQFDPNWNIVTP